MGSNGEPELTSWRGRGGMAGPSHVGLARPRAPRYRLRMELKRWLLPTFAGAIAAPLFTGVLVALMLWPDVSAFSAVVLAVMYGALHAGMLLAIDVIFLRVKLRGVPTDTRAWLMGLASPTVTLVLWFVIGGDAGGLYAPWLVMVAGGVALRFLFNPRTTATSAIV